MSKKFQLPTHKGTKLFPKVTQLPCKLVIDDGGRNNNGLRSALAFRYAGDIKRFHAKCQQMYNASEVEIFKQRAEWNGARGTYLNQFSNETIRVDVSPEVIEEELKKLLEGVPDFCVIDIVAHNSTTLEGRFVARNARYTPYDEAIAGGATEGQAYEGIEESAYDGDSPYDYSYWCEQGTYDYEDPTINFSEWVRATDTVPVNRFVASLLVDMRDLPPTGTVTIELFGIAIPGEDDIEDLPPTHEVTGTTRAVISDEASPFGWYSPHYERDVAWPSFAPGAPNYDPVIPAIPPVDELLEHGYEIRFLAESGSGKPTLTFWYDENKQNPQPSLPSYTSLVELTVPEDLLSGPSESVYYVESTEFYDSYLESQDPSVYLDPMWGRVGIDPVPDLNTSLRTEESTTFPWLPLGEREDEWPSDWEVYWDQGYLWMEIDEMILVKSTWQYAIWELREDTTGDDVDWDFDLAYQFYAAGTQFAESAINSDILASMWTLEKKPGEVPPRNFLSSLEVPGLYEEYYDEHEHPESARANTEWKHLGDVNILREHASIVFKPSEV